MADQAYIAITLHLVAALIAGGLIGMERGYKGRPAGFRTHALVCLASSCLMTLTMDMSQWLPYAGAEVVRTDPTRMAQGIMTGIGFLGAGVIFNEGLSVRGLTTAASIWVTAAIGILVGVGLYWVAAATTVLTIGTLSVFRWVEARLPARLHAYFTLRFNREQLMTEEALLAFMRDNHCLVNRIGYRMSDNGEFFDYRMMIQTLSPGAFSHLAKAAQKLDSIQSFKLHPTGD
ncbi:magnesium transporter MgtC [Idiomarina tyrosinivorans]|uniref:Protein MgtC n=1 Tax=Idiomarina tyrosinivorans TaxID=1445662 RepID=A0A432ZUH3_9GAMM|nr:MgtC/SapB family protein [Idiomarina tyrosinivorans]RUO81539.1 magnesium transporter MgtC [Idiomarina tyrosinivorans]